MMNIKSNQLIQGDAMQVLDQAGNSHHLKLEFVMPYITKTPTTPYLITAHVNRKQLG